MGSSAISRRGSHASAIAVATRYPDDFAFTEFGHVLALFAAGRLTEAESALQSAARKSPKLWKMLHSAKPKAPRPNAQGMTSGSDDEAFEYVVRHLPLWRSSGALQWSAGIKIPNKSATKVKNPLAAADQPDLLS